MPRQCPFTLAYYFALLFVASPFAADLRGRPPARLAAILAVDFFGADLVAARFGGADFFTTGLPTLPAVAFFGADLAAAFFTDLPDAIRAAAFFPPVFRAVFRAAFRAAFRAVGFLLAEVFTAAFLRVDFLAPGFLAAAFLATGFFATGFFATGFFAAACLAAGSGAPSIWRSAFLPTAGAADFLDADDFTAACFFAVLRSAARIAIACARSLSAGASFVFIRGNSLVALFTIIPRAY